MSYLLLQAATFLKPKDFISSFLPQNQIFSQFDNSPPTMLDLRVGSSSITSTVIIAVTGVTLHHIRNALEPCSALADLWFGTRHLEF